MNNKFTAILLRLIILILFGMIGMKVIQGIVTSAT